MEAASTTLIMWRAPRGLTSVPWARGPLTSTTQLVLGLSRTVQGARNPARCSKSPRSIIKVEVWLKKGCVRL